MFADFCIPYLQKCKILRNIHRKSYSQFPFKGTKANNVVKKAQENNGTRKHF